MEEIHFWKNMKGKKHSESKPLFFFVRAFIRCKVPLTNLHVRSSTAIAVLGPGLGRTGCIGRASDSSQSLSMKLPGSQVSMPSKFPKADILFPPCDAQCIQKIS